MSEEKGFNCVKGYGIIRFVSGGSGKAFCPISGWTCCKNCDVNTADEAKEAKQVSEKPGS